MSDKRESMQITLTPEQTRHLLAWAGERGEAEVDADCEPSGYHLEIGIGGNFPALAEAIKGSARLDLGEVDVILIDAK